MQNVDTQNKQKTIADFLFKEAPEAAISGLYKGMESGVNAIAKGMEFGVGILSDYVENPVRNVTLDVATMGSAKGLKFLGAAGLLNPRLGKESYSVFRGLENIDASKESLARLLVGNKIVGGGKKLFGMEQNFPKSTYTTLFPQLAEDYARGRIFKEGARNTPGTVLRFQIPGLYVSDINQKASQELAQALERNRMQGLDLIPNYEVKSILRKYGGAVQGNINEAHLPIFSDVMETARVVAKDPTLSSTLGTIRFREGVPVRFLEDLEFVGGKRTSQETIKRLNDPKRIQEVIDFLNKIAR
tara:strand:- start:332 stop:1234 length:903 start_codon:yes stop_codon:yes gene_type:complete